MLHLARQIGLETLEQQIRPEDALEADEIFLTGTACEILPVAAINDLTFTISEVTSVIAYKYHEYTHSPKPFAFQA